MLNDSPIQKSTFSDSALLCMVFVQCLAFFLFENTERDDAQVKLQLLRSLYESMASKYNMSIEEFNGFSKEAYEALSEPKRQWSYYEAVDFTFQAFTTIGKVQC